MRVLLVLLSSFAVASCSTIWPQRVQVPPPVERTKLPAELFACDGEPRPWAAGADDVTTAINETERTGAGRDCRRQLRRVCLTLTAIDQVTGECPDARHFRPSTSTRTPLLEQLATPEPSTPGLGLSTGNH